MVGCAPVVSNNIYIIKCAWANSFFTPLSTPRLEFKVVIIENREVH